MNGVYKICNKVNGKIYVGSSNNIKVRWAKHKALLRHHYHPNSHLQAAWDKYGEENFEFSLIESCSVEKLLIREQFFIDTLKPEYNQTAIAGKIEMTPSRRKKLSEATRNAYLSGRLIKTTKEVYQYDLKGNYMNHFNSLTEASEMTGTNLANLSSALNGRANIAGGFVWRFYKVDKLDVWFNRMGRPLTKEPYRPKHKYKKRNVKSINFS